MEASCLSCGNPLQTYSWVRDRSSHPKHVKENKCISLAWDWFWDWRPLVNQRNTFVLRTASEHAGQQIQLFSDLLLKKKAALARHMSRTHNNDPSRQITYAPSSASGFPIGKRRVGGPRQQWRHFTHKHIWDNFLDERTEYESTAPAKWLPRGNFESCCIANLPTL